MKGVLTNLKIGDKVNRCTFIAFAPIDRTKKSRAKRGLFSCDCGKEFVTTLEAVAKGKAKSCGCYNREVNMERKITYNAGEKFGDLIFICEAGRDNSGDRLDKFLCFCGNEFVTRMQSVKSEITKSCGCLTNKLLSDAGKLRDNTKNTKPVRVDKHQEITALSEEDVYRFWSKVAFTANPNMCWNWTGSTRPRGYGRFTLTVAKQKDISLVAPRVAYLLHYKEQPLDKCVLHSCDNPSCVNPKHLSLGTYLDNTEDMMNKGRHRNQHTGKIISNL